MVRALPLTCDDDGSWLLDCLGMLCPVPVIKTGQAIRRLPLGALLTVVADDPGVELDLQDWCTANRHDHVDCRIESGVFTTRIRRAR